MSIDLWNFIFDKYVIPYNNINSNLNRPTLIPHKDSDPILFKHFMECVSRIREIPQMALDIYTQGLLLKQPHIDFFASLPNPVRLMITFHFYNHDGSENDYTKTSQFLRSIIADKPRNVEITFVAHKSRLITMDRLQAWKDSWGDIAVINTHINPWTGLINEPGAKTHGHCPYDSFDHIFFGVTGNIIACCMDLEEQIVFGNVMTDEPAEMIEKLRLFYEAQRREMQHPLCSNCFGKENLVQLTT